MVLFHVHVQVADLFVGVLAAGVGANVGTDVGVSSHVSAEVVPFGEEFVASLVLADVDQAVTRSFWLFVPDDGEFFGVGVALLVLQLV